jgi:hypothetical protein
MSNKVDFEAARQAHAAWKTTVREYLDDKIELGPERIVSHFNCNLGKWYYSEGKALYGEIPEMKIFEIKHEKLHKIIKDIWDFKEGKDMDMVEDLYFDLMDTSDKIVKYLYEAENVINND